MNYWTVVCPESDVQGGVWEAWHRENCLAIGWPPSGYSSEGPTADAGWRIARNRLREMAPGDKIIPYLRNWRIGPVGTIVRVNLDDQHWNPTVAAGLHKRHPDEAELGRRIDVSWESNYMLPSDMIAVIPAVRRSRLSPPRHTAQSLDGEKFDQLIEVLQDPNNWVSVRDLGNTRRLIRFAAYSRKDVHDVFDPDSRFISQRGRWGLHGIVPIPDRPGDFVFFVTFGQAQSGHVFDEGVTEDGILTWQSQPRHGFKSNWIRRFIDHDDRVSSIYLFLRTERRGHYFYLGLLKYLAHDPDRQFPVWFHWQIIDWSPPHWVIERMGLQLQSDDEEEHLDSGPDGSSESFAGLVEATPPTVSSGRSGGSGFQRRRRTSESNREEENNEIGRAGEYLVLGHERALLIAAGRSDLADMVEHIAVTEGDGAGYDILSYTPGGEPKYIEVKTTKRSDTTPFFVSPNEIRHSEAHQDSSWLYRVYELRSDFKAGKFFAKRGSITETFQLTPTEYRARLLPSKD